MFKNKKLISILLSLSVFIGLISPMASAARPVKPDTSEESEGITVTIISDENGKLKDETDNKIVKNESEIKIFDIMDEMKGKVKPNLFYEFSKFVIVKPVEGEGEVGGEGEEGSASYVEEDIEDNTTITEDTTVKAINTPIKKDIFGPYSEEDLEDEVIPDNYVKLIFAEGANGVIPGKNIYIVKVGTKLGDVKKPLVIPNKGYRHIGWDKDDNFEIEIEDIEEGNVTTVTALYKKIKRGPVVNVEPEEKETKTHNLYTIGYPDGDFKPENGMTRAEVATIFSRLIEDKVFFDKVDTKFSDVKSDHWASGAIDYLSKKKIINGREDGKYYPEEKITRAEYATIIANMRKIKAEKDSKIEFSDIKGHWAEDIIKGVAEEEIIKGYDDKSFKPDKAVSRAEAVTMTNRAFVRSGDTVFIAENLEEKGIFPDVLKSHWAYTDIYEASLTHEFNRNDDNSETWLKITELGRELGMRKK